MHIHVLMAEDSMGGADLLIRSDLGVSILLNCTSWCSWRMRGIKPATSPLLRPTSAHSDAQCCFTTSLLLLGSKLIILYCSSSVC